MKRLRHFFNTLSTNWSEDPAARGAAKMTAGAVLVAEGLFGVVRRATSRNSKNAGGIIGAFFGMVFGAVFMGVGWMVQPEEIPDPVTTTGTIVDVVRTRNSDGDRLYKAVYEYQADGQTHQVNSSVSTSSRPRVGATVDMIYSESDPAFGRRDGGMEAWFPWIFIGAGALVAGTSFFSLLVSLALVGFGVWLFINGRADRKSVDANGGFFSDLISLAKRAKSGELDVERTAVGQKGSSAGDSDFFGMATALAGGGAGDIAAVPMASERASDAPPPEMPPQGWYPDPNDQAQLRWWDGERWTEHRRQK